MIFKTALAGWIGRRIFDWGGWLGTIAAVFITTYTALPPASQSAILKVFQGHWDDITIGAALPLISLLASQLFSLRATIKPQVVTDDGKKTDLRELPKATQTVVKEQAKTVVAKRPTFVETLGGLFRR